MSGIMSVCDGLWACPSLTGSSRDCLGTSTCVNVHQRSVPGASTGGGPTRAGGGHQVKKPF
jgi:hypothetical protein